MAADAVDMRRRRFLLAATAAAGGVGTIMVAVPFVTSMLPSAKAKAGGAPVQVDIGKLESGMLLTVEWRGKPVWILNRTREMLDLLGKQEDRLRDPQSSKPQQPEYSRNQTRSVKPEYFVAIALCTHLGCIPTYRPERSPADLGPDWNGGFFCPCHGSKFDLAGRVFKNVPAPLNLEIPPYQYLTDTQLSIGEDPRKA